MADAPTYSVAYTDTKIPVSKHAGKLWKARIDAACRARENKTVKAWREAIDYYNHDQSTTKADRQPGLDNSDSGTRMLSSARFDETENVVYANVNAIVPRVYMKNPRCEITPNVPTDEALAGLSTACERLVNILADKRVAPGFNYKPKGKRCVVMAQLTNKAWIEVDYIKKYESNEQTMEEIQKAADRLAKAQNQKEIEEIEGILSALEDRISILSPSGPRVKFKSPFNVVVDPDCEEDDASDAMWIATDEFVPTPWLNAMFGVKKGKDYKSAYSPTHVLAPGGDETANEMANNFTLLEDNKSYRDYGYDSQEEFDAAKRTRVWKIWDKSTRRLLMFHSKKWDQPVWVWDDPLRLDRFFPLIPLNIYTSPEPGECKGEVSYYLDQQDAINEINHEEKMARQWVRRKFIYNSSVISDDIMQKFIKSPDAEALGVLVPPDIDMSKAISAPSIPSMNFPQLFNKESKYAAIDKISKVNQIMRGGEFKTNTTNQAISEYNSVQSGSLDEHIDQIEDHTGQVFWCVLQLCLMNMSQQEVINIIGQEYGQFWRNMTPDEIQQTLSIKIVGGSSLKPTSQTKQKQALELGQILGQFASASPVAFLVALRAFERAFDEITVTEEDWKLIRASIEQELMPQPQGAQGGESQGGQGGQGGEMSGPPSSEPAAGGGEEAILQIAQMIDSMPPEAKEALARAIVGGAPIMDAVSEIMNTLNGANNA